MAFIIKKLRNHWKKSTFAGCLVTYGINYAIESYNIQELMREYCEEAREYGRQPISNVENPRKITVILNPNANNRKATKFYEQYCAPILNLSGVCVDVINTTSEQHARSLVEQFKDKTDTIVIAGGDGLVSECVTGLMRRKPDDIISLDTCVIGVLPLGKTNNFAKSLISKNSDDNNSANKTLLLTRSKKIEMAETMAKASIAIVRKNKLKKANVIKIELLDNDDDTVIQTNEKKTDKAIYAMSGLEWGSYRDAEAKTDKYWYFGSLKKYVTFIFNGYKNNLNWNCSAKILFSQPCSGCSNCYTEQLPKTLQLNSTKSSLNDQRNMNRWWGTLVPKNTEPSPFHVQLNHMKQIQNPDCTNIETKTISTCDLTLTVAESSNENIPPHLLLTIGSNVENINYWNFVREGWRSVHGEKRTVSETIVARQLQLIPNNNNNTQIETDQNSSSSSSSANDEKYFIDKEDFEVKPIKITLIPKVINVFCG